MADEEPLGQGTEQSDQEPQQEAELRIQQEHRSPDRVLPSENVASRENAIVQVNGDASLIINKGDSSFTLYDEQGEKVAIPGDLMIADWSKVEPHYRGMPWVIIKSMDDYPQDGSSSNYKLINNLPEDLKPVAEQMLQGVKEVTIPSSSWKIDTTDISQIGISRDDDHVMIFQPGTDSFIGFLTKDTAGNDLPPRNWKRVDTSTVNEITPSMEAVLNASGSDVREVQGLSANRKLIISEGGFVVQQNGSEVHRENISTEGNVAEDPRNPGILYFTEPNTAEINRVDTTNGPTISERFSLPRAYQRISNLKLDNSGEFITFNSQGSFIVLEKESMREVSDNSGMYHAILDDKDRIRAIDVDGHITTSSVSFEPLREAIRQRQVAEAARKAAEQLDPDVIAAKKAEELDRQYGHLKQTRDNLSEQIKKRVEGITDLNAFNEEFDKVTQLINGMGLQPGEQDYMRPALEKVVQERKQAVVMDVFSADLTSLQDIIGGSMDMTTYGQAANILANLNSLRGEVTDDAVKQQLQELEGKFQEKDKQFRQEQNEHIKTTTIDVIARAKQAIAGMKSKSALAVWSEEELSAYRSELGNLRSISIPENHGVIDQAQTAILRAIKERREAIEDLDASSGTTETDLREIQMNSYKEEIRGLLETMGDQGFQSRDQIARYLDGSNRYTELRDQVEELLRSDPQAGREIRRELGVSLALYMAEVERATRSDADGDGRPMVMLGEVPFPVWQERRKSKREKEKHVELSFIPDPNAPPTREDGKTVTLGEIGVQVRNGKPDVTLSRVYQGKTDEEEWRNGLVEYRGTYTEGTRVTNIEMQKIKKDYRDWQRGEGSDIRKELTEKKKAFQDYFLERPVTMPDGSEVTLREAKAQIKRLKDAGEQVPTMSVDVKNDAVIQKPYTFAEGDNAADWEQEYKSLVRQYGEFVAENNVLLFERLDELKKAPDTDEPSSLGYVPEWKSHWTIDKQTSDYLGKMAKDATMQLELQQGIINLEGHAGTGKDVLVKMFCHETKRPYFAFDCSKWTVESDLAEDITLENGSVVKIPSAVLQAIETPGAVLYFNSLSHWFKTLRLDIFLIINQSIRCNIRHFISWL